MDNDLYAQGYGDVIWVSSHLESPITRLFAQQSIHSGYQHQTLALPALFGRNTPMAGAFSSQQETNIEENMAISWRHERP